MPYEIQEKKSYDKTPQEVYEAALKAAAGLDGKLLKQDAEKRALEIKFDKKILGKVLGDRTKMSANVTPADGGASIAVEAYPIDAVGRKQMFGARKGVTQTVMTWFFAHLDHHLGVAK